MKLKLKRIEVLKAGYISGLLYLLLSTFVLVPLALISMAFGHPNALGIGMIFILPIIYGLCGFVCGLIMAALYNLVSKWTGGLEVEVQEIKEFTEKEEVKSGGEGIKGRIGRMVKFKD